MAEGKKGDCDKCELCGKGRKKLVALNGELLADKNRLTEQVAALTAERDALRAELLAKEAPVADQQPKAKVNGQTVEVHTLPVQPAIPFKPHSREQRNSGNGNGNGNRNGRVFGEKCKGVVAEFLETFHDGMSPEAAKDRADEIVGELLGKKVEPRFIEDTVAWLNESMGNKRRSADNTRRYLEREIAKGGKWAEKNEIELMIVNLLFPHIFKQRPEWRR